MDEWIDNMDGQTNEEMEEKTKPSFPAAFMAHYLTAGSVQSSWTYHPPDRPTKSLK